MENTFGCWSGNMRIVYPTAHNWDLSASQSSLTLCCWWLWLLQNWRWEDAYIWFWTPVQAFSRPKNWCIILLQWSSDVFLLVTLLACCGPPWPPLLVMTHCWIVAFTGLLWSILCLTPNPVLLWLLCYWLSAQSSTWKAVWETKAWDVREKSESKLEAEAKDGGEGAMCLWSRLLQHSY